MTTFSQWVQGARPRTLPAAIAPVAAGTGLSLLHVGYLPGETVPRSLLALVLALALQVGVNYANDYSDGVKGTDDDRVGPFRLVGSGAADAASVKRAAFACFGVGAVAGTVLVGLAGAWWLLAVGVLCILAAWFYTGGSKPYGYLGLGEVMVFVFFGLVAVMGTSYLISGRTGWVDLLVASGVGLWACAIMLTNNLRDIPTDTQAGKMTLAVRLGDARTRLLCAACLVVPFVLLLPVAYVEPFTALAFIALPMTTAPIQRVLVQRASGRDLIPVLGMAGRLELVASLLLLGGCVLGTWLG
ncbi:MAG: 1,4-dihydroxy-2-naphthoate polyprenyltransferase [Dermabacter sp.]|nr:1,4-dihydroxy-2-naphthoate polyprenyltransferase [Dermabacter sp.]